MQLQERLGALIFAVSSAWVSAAGPGDLDDYFAAGGVDEGSIAVVAAQNDGRLLVAGYFHGFNGRPYSSLVRLHPDGAVDETFQFNSLGGHLHTVLPLADGKILVGGEFGAIGEATRIDLARLNPDGSLDVSFNPGAGSVPGHVDAASMEPGGAIVIAGDFTSFDSAGYGGIVRLTSDGRVDRSFDAGARMAGHLPALVRDNEGRWLAGGTFRSCHGLARYGLTRLNRDGTLDWSFNIGIGAQRGDLPGNVNAIALQRDSRVVIGGNFTRINGEFVNQIARLNPDGSLDRSFAATVDGYDSPVVHAIVIQADGKILIAGSFSMVSGQLRNNVARLNRDGELDSSFNPPAGFDASVNAVLIQSSGQIVVGGYFASVNGVQRRSIARLRGDWRHAEPASHQLTARMLPDDWVGIGVAGPEECSYTIECSEDLRTWRTLTNFVGRYGSNSARDRLPPGVGQRFYRLLTPP